MSEELKKAHDRRVEEQVFGTSSEAREQRFRVEHRKEHCAYITAARDGCRFNITSFKVFGLGAEVFNHSDLATIRRIVEQGQASDGEKVDLWIGWTQQKRMGKDIVEVDRKMLFTVLEN